MEPDEHLVRIDGFVNVFPQILEDEALLSCSVSRYPEPPVAHVVVKEENVALLEPENNVKSKKNIQDFSN